MFFDDVSPLISFNKFPVENSSKWMLSFCIFSADFYAKSIFMWISSQCFNYLHNTLRIFSIPSFSKIICFFIDVLLPYNSISWWIVLK
jgi:hypothetical protein